MHSLEDKFSDTILSQQNWQDAVYSAIDALPEDIRASIGHGKMGENGLIVTASVEGIDDDYEIMELSVTYWPTYREYRSTFDDPDSMVPLKSELDDCAVVVVENPRGYEEAYNVGRARILLLCGGVQLAACELLFVGGLINKDTKGRFIRRDGSFIFPWQTDNEDEAIGGELQD